MASATAGSSSPPTPPHADDSPEPSLPGEKVYVTVGREVAESRATLLWALHKFAGAGAGAASFVLLHVYSPPKLLPFMGARIPAAQVGEQELAAYKKMELQIVNHSLDQYIHLCAQGKIHAEKLVVESDDVGQGLVELISQHHVTALVMGAAADMHYTKKMKTPKSRKARFVEQQADPLCKIWFICKGTLVYRRKAVQLSHEEMQECRQSSRVTHYSVEKSASLSEMWCVANTWLCNSIGEPQIERTSSDPFDISGKAQASEKSYFREMKQKNELEEKLTTIMEEIESLTVRTDELCAKLQGEREQRVVLEKRSAHSDRIIKDLMLQRDKALRETEALRSRKGESTPTEERMMHITEFSYSEIKEATNNFDHSMKIGESVYGSVYKGFLRHTNVAIKKLNPETTQTQSQFSQEVEILSRVRHPNLVTLVGACKDAQTLVYEYMPNGSLDDRLACKDNSKPLSWQLRTRVASNICSALIFLHSNKPHSIVHSDLKASNILLDGNNVAKLSGFGVSQILTDQFKATTTLYRYTHPKGSFVYIDPEYLISGDLTPLSDVYSFGIILLRLLTGRSGFGLLKEVQQAMDKGCLQAILDSSAGEWPSMYAEQLAELGLRCCNIRRKNRPDLQTEVWTVLEPMFKSASVMICSLSFKSVSEDLGGVPSYFICPIVQDVMRDPLIAADGFTYEAEAIREWLDSGHRTSPMTNLELPHRDLLPNHALRSAIQEWLQTNGD
ncbi:unnamed protein product [Urochloa decumbens]|uniref:RING-type E3 ubiquitin transferase n=1 Tax=Urochloa decumbens TaxID=240449 RepID=A0ABC9G9P4_9POAL